MNNFERVQQALNHKVPDRVPFDLGATYTTGININAYRRIQPYFGLEEEPSIMCLNQQLAEPNENFLRKVGTEFRGAYIQDMSSVSIDVSETDKYYKYTDGWDMTWNMPKEAGHYFSLIDSPLADVNTVEEMMRRIKYPDPHNPDIIEHMKGRVDRVMADGYVPILNSFCTGIMESAALLLGYEKFYLSLGINPILIEGLLDLILDIKLAYWEHVLDEMGDKALILQESDDLGTQNSPLISPAMYRKFIKPRHKKLFDYLHKRTDAKVLYHSCGSVYDMIPDLIDTGVDILNPVQFTAAKMDAENLKKEFGKDLVFWGGVVDTQKVLPMGTPQEVEDQIKRQIDILSKDGGFVISSVHNIQGDVPKENLEAFFRTVDLYR